MRRPAVLLILAPLFASAQSSTPLDREQTLTREIQLGEIQSFVLPAQTGSYFQIRIAAKTATLRIELQSPDGKTAATAEANWRDLVEDIPWIAATPGDYQLRLRATEIDQTPGRFDLTVEGFREPTPQDRKRVTAYTASAAGRDAAAQSNAPAVRKAIERYEEALGIWRELGDLRWQGRILHELGSAWESLGQTPKARQTFELALEARRASGNRYGEALALNSLGLTLTNSGDAGKAVEYLGASLELRRLLRDRRGEAVTLNNLGLAYRGLGDHTRALEVLLTALPIRREVKDRRGEAVTLNNISGEYQSLAQWQRAFATSLQSLAIRREMGDRRGEASTLNALALGYHAFGEYKRALDYMLQSVAIYESLGDQRTMASGLNNLGALHSNLGQNKEAMDYLNRALTIRREIGDRAGECNTLIWIGSVQLNLGDVRSARQTEEEATALAVKIGLRVHHARGQYYAAQADHALGETDRAQERLRVAADMFAAEKAPEYESAALNLLADYELGAGNLDAALEHSRLAMGLTESVRTAVASPELRAALRSRHQSQYALYVEILMEQHRQNPARNLDALALDAAERSRARSFVEMLSEAHVDPRNALTPEQKSREDQILARITAAQRELFRKTPTAARQAELDRQLAAAESELERFRLEVQTLDARYAAIQYAPSLASASIRTELLHDDSALIEYSLGARRSYVWAVTPQGLTSAVLPKRAEIDKLVAAFRRELASRPSTLTVQAALGRLDARAAELYRTLVGPIENAIASSRRLIVVPDGSLAYLPFEALGRNTRMIDRYAISYSPSASAVVALRNRAESRLERDRPLLAFADPMYNTVSNANPSPNADQYRERGLELTALPFTRTEVSSIQSLFPKSSTRVYLGQEAKEENLKAEQLERYRYVHFATHGHYDEQSPSRSGIILSMQSGPLEDGMLQVPEVMRLRLRAEMVILSACQTGLGEIVAGEGVMGLARAFLYAGAESVVTSLWNVNDASTAELMKLVYRNLKQGMSRDQAVRQSKLALMKGSQRAWRHPFYWASFVVMGDAR